MIYKILGGVVLALVVLVFVALEVRTTGSYERTFDASPDKVWWVWNDADSIKHWWGPKGYTAPFIRNDLRVGGTYLWAMKSSKGEMFWNTGVYEEVVPNKRIVSSLSFADETGKAIPGSKAPVPGRWPNAVTVIVEFSESSGKTKVTVTEVGLPLMVMILSRVAWQQQFDKIEGLLEGKTLSSIVLGRLPNRKWIGVGKSTCHHRIDCVNTIQVLLGYEVADGTLDQIQNVGAVTGSTKMEG